MWFMWIPELQQDYDCSWSKHDFTSCEIDHSECHSGGGRHMVSQICQARSPDKNLGATDPRAPVSRERWLSVTPIMSIIDSNG